MLLALSALLVAPAGAAPPEGAAPDEKPSVDDIVVGEEQTVVGAETEPTAPRVDYGGGVYDVPPAPGLPDLPVHVEPEGDGFRISIGDEVSEATKDIGEWDSSDTPHRFSIGHDVYVAPGEIVEGDIWTIGGDVVVAGTVDGKVIAFAGDVLVEGEVVDEVVAMWGSIELDPAAICGGDVVAFGGDVAQNRAHVDGEALSFSVLPGAHGSEQLERAIFLCAIASLVLFGAFALVLGLIFRSNTERMLGEIRTRPLHALWVGFALHVIGPLVLFLLLVTFIGIPLALVGWLLWWAIAQSGVVLGAVRLGQAVLRRPAVRAVLPGALVGGLLLHGPFILGVLAFLRGGPGAQTLGLTIVTVVSALAGILTLIGSGALVTTRFGEGSRKEPPEIGSTPLFDPISRGDRAV